MIERLQYRSKRATYGAIAVLTLVLTMAQGLLPFISNSASAAGFITSRQIQMSDSTLSATAVSYAVTFTPATTGVQSMVLEFCTTPIIGAACTAPTGFSISAALLGSGPAAGWTKGTGSASVFKLTGTSAIAALTPQTFTITGVTNPSANGTFYARILTYTGNAYGGTNPTGYVSATNTGTAVLDQGSVALSINDNINVSAAVMETLVFCVSGALPTQNCAGTTTPNVPLGHGTPLALDASAVDTNTAYMQVSSNAANGVTVYMKNSNACGGLSRNGGTTCDIAPMNDATTATALTAGVAKFGMQVGSQLAATGAGTPVGTITPTAPYNGTTTNYGMNNLSGSTVTSPFGSPIANTASAPISNMNSLLTFGASASNVTPAGLYTAKLILVAVGTY